MADFLVCELNYLRAHYLMAIPLVEHAFPK